MKKFILLTLLAGFIYPAAGYCQLSKGNLMGPFSIGLSYYHENQKDDETKDLLSKANDINLTLSDALGIFVIDHLAVGPGLTFQLENYSEKYYSGVMEGVTSTTLSYGILFTPFVRYYFAESGKLAFFVQASAAIGYGQNFNKYKHGANTDKYDVNMLKYGGGAGVGLTYFFNDNIGLETQLVYNYQGEQQTNKVSGNEYKYTYSRNTIGINVGLAFYLQP